MKKVVIFDFSGTLVEAESSRVLVPREKLAELKKKGYKLALFTSGTREELSRYVSGTFRNIFDMCVFREDTKETKPSREGVIKIIKKLKPEKIVYVGDSESDLKAAVSAGVPFLTPDAIYLL